MSGSPARAHDAPLLRLVGASFGYGERVVVDGVDLEVRAGESVALLGSNGSGKTTLLRGVLGLAARTGGRVEMGGEPAPSRRSRRRTGYVPQAMTVGGGVPSTVREVVATGRLPLRPWWRPAGRADAAAVRAALEAVDMASHAHEDVTELSGGQQRRVLVARALAAEPELLVLDEPLAGVDAANARLLADALGRLSARGVTLLVVTHEIGPLADVVRRAVVLRQGRVVHDGPLVPELLGAEAVGDADAATGAARLLHDHHVHHHDEDEPSPRGWVDHPDTRPGPGGLAHHPEEHDDERPGAAAAGGQRRG
ncbi:metal ABC transporter ATP-binding protein [Pseudokineococcus lusitanus]|uniref:Zinc transport system ATP-binding protein n=1 Tax=Pseudokineococcus lusitanus TaxID=763993 RepID=A0A3N1HTK8_9ACTN|nr:metal ABC transporter ATP-binding protein [Pseudokineococcus lusitanus]ROP45799.1 zinc transport system ATP-binding protein [Pseudokineococcus lusitanus]